MHYYLLFLLPAIAVFVVSYAYAHDVYMTHTHGDTTHILHHEPQSPPVHVYDHHDTNVSIKPGWEGVDRTSAIELNRQGDALWSEQNDYIDLKEVFRQWQLNHN